MGGEITVFLADDNVIVREGVRALLEMEEDIAVVGVAVDYDGLVAGAEGAAPHVVVTDIRMPPTFHREGIEGAREVRKRHPGTGIVILSQFEEPEYAVSLLSEGAAGFAYLLKDRVADSDQLVRAVREVSAGGSMIDPRIVEKLLNPVREEELTASEERLLQHVGEGKPIKAIAASEQTTPEAVAADIEQLFMKLAKSASEGEQGALRQLKALHQAIVEREEQGERLSRLLPSGLGDRLRREGFGLGDTELLDVTVLISDVRGYSGIAERSDPSTLARQLSEHRAAMNAPILAADGTVMQFVGDSVMAVFGAPVPQERHAEHALDAALGMQVAQDELNEKWAAESLPRFFVGVGLSTGRVAAALLGSEARLEYSLVGDSVNLAQRLQELAGPGEIVLSEATVAELGDGVEVEPLTPCHVKGRETEVRAYRLEAGGSGR